MYNRYIPQPDGSFRRNRVSEPQPQRPAPPPREEATPVFSPAPAPQPSRRPCPPSRPPAPRPRKQPEPTGVGSFLRQHLPKDFDTEDLLIVLLLLLMSGDCREDQNSALLTLALYLFL